jgi:hypothetical protein
MQIGFTGSRDGFSNNALVSQIARAVHGAGHVILVGCANGVDAIIRQSVPYKIYSIASPASGTTTTICQALARRSQTMVSHSSVLIGFASINCPAIVNPTKHFCGSGSGTWASIAYAVSQGKQVFVFKSAGVLLPAWSNGQWVQAVPSGVWSQAYTWQANNTQLSLI